MWQMRGCTGGALLGIYISDGAVEEVYGLVLGGAGEGGQDAW